MMIPAGTPLAAFEIELRSGPEQILAAGSILPKNLVVTPGLEETVLTQQRVQPLAPALLAGTESWDLRLVAGASLASANARAVQAGATGGDLLLNNPYSVITKTDGGSQNYQAGVSVIRTGSGDLELIAARDYRQDSPFGVYTAGGALAENLAPAVERPRQNDGTLLGENYSGDPDDEEERDYNRVAEATAPAFLTGGGNVTVQAGRDLRGHQVAERPTTDDWLWSQGPVASGERAAWWINTGTYALDRSALTLPAFAGIGALGGGNVNVSTGGDLGVGGANGAGGIEVVIGASGWVDSDGAVHQVGGGDLRLSVGGGTDQANDDAGSVLTNLRGDLTVRTGAAGDVRQSFAVNPNNTDPRPDSLLREVDKQSLGRLKLVVGDARARVQSVGDLVAEIIEPLVDNEVVDPWSAGSAIDLLTAGGDLVFVGETAPADTRVIATSGIIYGGPAFASSGDILVRPSLDGEVEFLAGDSIYSLGLSIENDLAAAGVAGLAPARFYALQGDIYDLQYGDSDLAGGSRAGRPAYVRAGRDIVQVGTPAVRNLASGLVTHTGSAFGHHAATDVSLIEAGRDLIHINAVVTGPGTLELTAGRNFYQADNGWVRSSAGSSGTIDSGADIAINVGMGEDGPDYQALIDAYLNPANLADPERPLADQPDKVVKIYDTELRDWLLDRYGEEALADSAPLDYFAALAPEQQRIFLRQLYYAELRAGGREYNDPEGDRTGSYLRGRRVIGTLLPKVDSEAGTSGYQGDYTMFSTGERSGMVRTEFGGDIQMLVPGGDIVVGVEGVTPEFGDNGILTQGSGDIQLYSQGDIALGLSRIFTTYGGDIFAWTGAGDINAGRGAKTTLVYTPPRRVYDDIGNVALSPAAPSTGAGIATLAPIPEVPPGDIDLIAPLGIIDAGEAGIRVSGNVNIAALQVINAENIQVQGDATGLPVVAAVNVSALTSASNAANSAVQAAEQVGRRSSNRPSVITVEILGYGEERLQSGGNPSSAGARYQPQGPVQVLGVGRLSNGESAPLTDAERRSML